MALSEKQSTDRVAQALGLRRWALGVLAGDHVPPPPAEEEAWRLFVEVERCALPLRARVGAGIPALDQRFDLEIQRVLSVQALLRHADRALAGMGESGVALKGAVPLLHGGEPLDVMDLDLLVSPGAVAPLAAALEAAGFDVGKDAPDSLPVAAPGGWERAVRVAEGSVQAELHVALPFIPEHLDPLADRLASPLAAISTPAPLVHLWHVLAHGAIHHPDRRGVLRELLLVRDAAAACSQDHLRELRRTVGATPGGEHLLRTLEVATRLDTDARDGFGPEAALRYRVAEHYLALGPRLRPWLWAAAFALLAGGGEYRRLWFGTPRSAWGGGHGGAALRPLRFAWRAAQLMAVTPLAWSAARRARRVAE